jgi:hypothetical protein
MNFGKNNYIYLSKNYSNDLLLIFSLINLFYKLIFGILINFF